MRITSFAMIFVLACIVGCIKHTSERSSFAHLETANYVIAGSHRAPLRFLDAEVIDNKSGDELRLVFPSCAEGNASIWNYDIVSSKNPGLSFSTHRSSLPGSADKIFYSGQHLIFWDKDSIFISGSQDELPPVWMGTLSSTVTALDALYDNHSCWIVGGDGDTKQLVLYAFTNVKSANSRRALATVSSIYATKPWLFSVDSNPFVIYRQDSDKGGSLRVEDIHNRKTIYSSAQEDKSLNFVIAKPLQKAAIVLTAATCGEDLFVTAFSRTGKGDLILEREMRHNLEDEAWSELALCSCSDQSVLVYKDSISDSLRLRAFKMDGNLISSPIVLLENLHAYEFNEMECVVLNQSVYILYSNGYPDYEIGLVPLNLDEVKWNF